MKTDTPQPPEDSSEEIVALIETLHLTEQRLEELTGGEVDSVANRDGQTFVLRHAQEQLRLNESARQAAILNALPASIALLDSQGKILSVNEAWQRFGHGHAAHTPGHDVGVNYLTVCDQARGDDAAEASQAATGIRAVLDGKLSTYALEYPCHSPAERRWFLMTMTPLSDSSKGAVVMHLNITERKLADAEVHKLQEQFHEQAIHDPLTGLYNRRYLDETINRELTRAERYHQPIGIVMCDLDHFKLVNDTHGHLAGDEVLRVLAELLNKHSRRSDIVCRFGGEEFVMFLPDMPLAVAYQRAEKLRTELAAKWITLGAADIQVTASFGVAAFPVNGKTRDALMGAADAAMYQAKESGRNRVVAASAIGAGSDR
ncbi:MAG: diguanylate cyclase [Thiobacillus sp.]